MISPAAGDATRVRPVVCAGRDNHAVGPMPCYTSMAWLARNNGGSSGYLVGADRAVTPCALRAGSAYWSGGKLVAPARWCAGFEHLRVSQGRHRVRRDRGPDLGIVTEGMVRVGDGGAAQPGPADLRIGPSVALGKGTMCCDPKAGLLLHVVDT